MYILQIFYVFSAIFQCSAYRILALFPSENLEHYVIYEPLLRELGERGHSLTIITHFSMKNPPKHYQEISLKGFRKACYHNHITENISTFQFIEETFRDTVKECNDFLNWPAMKYFKNSSQNFDVILFGQFIGDCHLGFIPRFKTHHIALFPNPISATWNEHGVGAIYNPSFIRGYFSGFSKWNFIGRVKNAIINFYSRTLYATRVLVREQKLIKVYFGDDAPPLKTIIRKTSLVLVNSHYSLHGNLPRFANVVEVGGIHIRPSKIPDFSGALNILALFPYPGKSHHYVIDELLNRLLQDGHHITFAGHFPANPPQINRTDIVLKSNTSMENETIDLAMTKYASFQIIFEMYLVSSIAKETCENLLTNPGIIDLLKNKPKFDIALVEQFISDCSMGIVHRLGIPSIGILPDLMFPWHFDRFGGSSNPSSVPCHNLGYGTHPNLIQTAISLVTCSYMNLIYNLNSVMPVNRMMKEHLGPDIPDIHDLNKEIGAAFVNAYSPLHGSSLKGDNIIEVGGIHIKKTKKLPADLQAYLDDAKDGVVYFSFGSMVRGSTMAPEKMKAFHDVFAQLPLKVLWKWESESMENAPANVLVRKWLPQLDILSHPNVKAFISHGGMLSTTEAVYCGVPIVAIPLFGDQFANAAAAEEKGLGVILNYGNITHESVSWALQAVLDPKMQESAKRLSEIWKDRPQSPMDTAIFWIEHVAKYGGKHLRPASADLPLYKYLLIDVIAFLTIVESLLVLLVYKILLFMLRALCSTSRKAAKNKKD